MRRFNALDSPMRFLLTLQLCKEHPDPKRSPPQEPASSIAHQLHMVQIYA
jgi:hypothetical protein